MAPANRPQPPLQKPFASSNPEARLTRQVESKVAEGDIRGAVRLLASSEGIAPYTPETLNALKLKHPTATAGCSSPFTNFSGSIGRR